MYRYAKLACLKAFGSDPRASGGLNHTAPWRRSTSHRCASWHLGSRLCSAALVSIAACAQVASATTALPKTAALTNSCQMDNGRLCAASVTPSMMHVTSAVVWYGAPRAESRVHTAHDDQVGTHLELYPRLLAGLGLLWSAVHPSIPIK